MMFTMLSSFLSFLMAGLPKAIDFFQNKADHAHELELAKLQTERELALAKEGFAAQQRVEEIRFDELKTSTASDEKIALIGAQQAEMQAIYAHDTSLNEGTSVWVKNLRALVRPLLTYGFFLLLVAIDVMLCIYGYDRGATFKELADTLWDDETQCLFAAIISFHFGGRAFGK